MPNSNYENCMKLAYDDTNVTETKPAVEFMKVLAKLALVVVIFYLLIYITVGFVIASLTNEKQAKLEEFLSQVNDMEVMKIDKKDRMRLENAKKRVLSIDTNFSKTSTLDIEIIDVNQKNAFCLPNGKIYVTLPLYRTLNDEMLTFVIAHEMGHYKNKDHLMKLRKYISANSVLILISILNSDSESITKLASGILTFEDLNSSRRVERKADLYAKNVMLGLYNNTEGAIEALKILEDKKHHGGLALFSTHPTIENRIKLMEN